MHCFWTWTENEDDQKVTIYHIPECLQIKSQIWNEKLFRIRAREREKKRLGKKSPKIPPSHQGFNLYITNNPFWASWGKIQFTPSTHDWWWYKVGSRCSTLNTKLMRFWWVDNSFFLPIPQVLWAFFFIDTDTNWLEESTCCFQKGIDERFYYLPVKWYKS